MNRSPLAVAVVPTETTLVGAVAAVMAHPLWGRKPTCQILVELRLDRMADASPAALAWAAQQLGCENIVATYRSVQEGGGLNGAALHSAAAQQQLLRHAFWLGVGFVDVELALLAREHAEITDWATAAGPHRRSKIVASFHPSVHVPFSELTAMALQAAKLGAQAFKVVLPATDDARLHGAFATWGHGPQPLPVLPLIVGASGLWSRLLVGKQQHPPPYTLAHLDGAPSVAPGQPSLSQAILMYGVAQVHAHTQVFGVAGHPVSHSLSPSLHSRAMAERGVDGIYLPFDVPGPLAFWLEHVALKLAVEGLSVTAPHKGAAYHAAHTIGPEAQAVGAVNTLVRVGSAAPGRWQGHNTDGAAAVSCLREGLPRALSGAQILLLGAGGAAKAVAFALARAGAQVGLWGRRSDGAAMACAQVNGPLPNGTRGVVPVHTKDLAQALARCDGLIHCTPVGMEGAAEAHGSVLCVDQLARLPKEAVVFDTVYAPPQTPLMARAQELGLTVMGGQEMLRRQAKGQFDLFYGPPTQIVGPRP